MRTPTQAKDIKKGDRFSTNRTGPTQTCSQVRHDRDPMNLKFMIEVYTGFDWMPYYLRPDTILYVQESKNAQ